MNKAWFVVYKDGTLHETVITVHPFVFRKQMFDKGSPILLLNYKELTPEEVDLYFKGE